MLDAPNLFDRFGGIRPMAEKLQRPPSTIQSWKTAGRVPATEQPFVLERADALGLDVTAADVVYPLQARPFPSTNAYNEDSAPVRSNGPADFDRNRS